MRYHERVGTVSHGARPSIQPFSRNIGRPVGPKIMAHTTWFITSTCFTRNCLGVAYAVLVGCLAVCLQPNPSWGQQPPEGADWPKRITQLDDLQNTWQLSARVYSGGEPHSADAFKQLYEAGIRTLVSVDGKVPDVEAARQQGLRYIHIPVGYDSVDNDAQLSLTQVSRQIQGPIYVHCHHGLHRGPAAAAVLCRIDDGRSAKEAEHILAAVGTSHKYMGLWQSVREYSQRTASAARLPELVAIAKPRHTATVMADIGRLHEELNASLEDAPSQAQRRVQLAILLQELFAELPRTAASGAPELASQYTTAAQDFEVLATLLQEKPKARAATVASQMRKIADRCGDCHTKHRN